MDTVDAAGHSENAAVLDLRILGPLEAWRGSTRLNLGGPRQRSVLVACSPTTPLVPLINRVATVVVSPQVGNVINRDGFGPLLDQMWLR